MLATSAHNVVNVLSKDESIPMNLPSKAFGSSFVESSSRVCIDRRRFTKSPKLSPRNRFFEDSQIFLKKKHFESLAKYKKRIILSNWRCEQLSFFNKKGLSPSQEIVLPIQSLATSHQANMKIVPGDVPFSHRKVDNNDQPQTTRTTKAFGPLELAIQEVKKPSTNKKDASIGVVGDISMIKNTNNLAIRVYTIEAKKQPIFLSSKFSSLRVTSSKDELYSNIYMQAKKSAKSGATTNQTTRKSPLDLKLVKPEFDANLKLKLKNIVARLCPKLR